MIRNSFTAMSMRRDEYQAKLGFALFIASLTMFFLAGLVGFAVIRFSGSVLSIPVATIPWPLFLGTLSMLSVSWMLHRSVGAVRRERQAEFRQWLRTAVILAVFFMVYQALGLSVLLDRHDESRIARILTPQYGVAFFLIFVHALHVVGGMAFLGWIVYFAQKEVYDHEKHWTVDICALYWHFLDIVWIVMLGTFLLSR